MKKHACSCACKAGRLRVVLFASVFAALSAIGKTYYVDSAAPSGGDGSEAAPLNNLGALYIEPDAAYLLKCGSVFSNGIAVNEPNVTLASYGRGDAPCILGNVTFTADNGSLSGLKISGEGSGSVVSFRNCAGGIINSCELVDGGNGVYAESVFGTLKIASSSIRGMLEDGIRGEKLEALEIRGCRISEVNRYWAKGLYALADGNGIHVGDSDFVFIENTCIDRSNTSGGSGISLDGCEYFEMNSSQVVGAPQNDAAKAQKMQIECVSIVKTEQAHFGGCWFYSGHSGIVCRESGYVEVMKCAFILNEKFGLENVGNTFAQGNLFYRSGEAGVSCDWNADTIFSGKQNLFVGSTIRTQDSVDVAESVFCPAWNEADTLDVSSVAGQPYPFIPTVISGKWADWRLHNGNDAVDLHLYHLDKYIVEGYFLSASQSALKIFFDVAHGTFTVLPPEGKSGKLEVMQYTNGESEQPVALREKFRKESNYDFSKWSDGVYRFALTDSGGAVLYEQFLQKNGMVFNPIELAGANARSNPQDVFRRDAVVYSADSEAEPSIPRKLVSAGNGFHPGYFVEFGKTVPAFFNSQSDELLFSPSDPASRYSITIADTSGGVVHREQNTRGLCSVSTDVWNDGFYHLELKSADGTVWANSWLMRNKGSVEPLVIVPATATVPPEEKTDPLAALDKLPVAAAMQVVRTK